MKVVLLAAGFATRMYPLTRDRAKPLLDVAGRPVLSRLLDRVLAIGGIAEVVVVANRRFAKDFEAWRDGVAAPVPVRVVDDGATDDDNKLGASGDLALALRSFESAPAGDPVMVVAGDNLVDFDLAPYAETFRAGDGPLLLVREIEGEVPPRKYSEVVLDESSRVTSFREKPEDPRSNLSCICLYFFPPEIRDRVDEYLAGGGDPDAPGHFLAWLSERESLRAARVVGPWHDIGSLATLEAARAAFASTAR